MARTVVPGRKREQRRTGVAADAGDPLPDRLIKFVPAETLAFFVPAAAALGSDRDGLLITAVVVGAIGTAGYLWTRRPSDPTEQPRPIFYGLAVAAFVAWALTTAPSFASMLGLDDVATGFILLAAIFLIPLADTILNTRGDEPPAPPAPAA